MRISERLTAVERLLGARASPSWRLAAHAKVLRFLLRLLGDVPVRAPEPPPAPEPFGPLRWEAPVAEPKPRAALLRDLRRVNDAARRDRDAQAVADREAARALGLGDEATRVSIFAAGVGVWCLAASGAIAAAGLIVASLDPQRAEMTIVLAFALALPPFVLGLFIGLAADDGRSRAPRG